jgi:hypothetical protein
MGITLEWIDKLALIVSFCSCNWRTSMSVPSAFSTPSARRLWYALWHRKLKDESQRCISMNLLGKPIRHVTFTIDISP